MEAGPASQIFVVYYSYSLSQRERCLVIEYKFVAVHGSMLFEDRMKELVEKGWMPLGGPAVKVIPNQPDGSYDDRPTFYQHMVRGEDDN